MGLASPETTPAPSTSSSSSPIGANVLPTLSALVETLDGNRIRYCHWKSNLNLGRTLAGDTDVDMLIHRADATRFLTLIAGLGFKPSVHHSGPTASHFYALDAAAGRLVHLHTYFGIITGGTVLKNHRLHLEEMLLTDLGRVQGVPVPSPAAELVSFVVRKMLEWATVIEGVFLAREGRGVADEITWLRGQATDQQIAAILTKYLPQIELPLFLACTHALRAGAPRAQRFRLARQVAARLRHHTCHSRFRASVLRTVRVTQKVTRRLQGQRTNEVLLAGGAVIAVVGSDGAGKSTVLTGLRDTFGECLAVTAIHAGKPPATALTFVPSVLVPAARRLLPSYRGTKIEAAAEEHATQTTASLRRRPLFAVYALRALMIAHDRARLLRWAHRRAASGHIVLSDRYPTLQTGVPEGPALYFVRDDPNPFYRWAARRETALYASIPRADLVLHLDVPVEIATHRNLTRDKADAPKPGSVIRRRHALAVSLEFPGTQVRHIDASGALQDTLRDAKRAAWESL